MTLKNVSSVTSVTHHISVPFLNHQKKSRSRFHSLKIPLQPSSHYTGRVIRIAFLSWLYLQSSYYRIDKTCILLMEEIVHHLGCKKLVNNGVNSIQPSTVVINQGSDHCSSHVCLDLPSRKMIDTD